MRRKKKRWHVLLLFCAFYMLEPNLITSHPKLYFSSHTFNSLWRIDSLMQVNRQQLLWNVLTCYNWIRQTTDELMNFTDTKIYMFYYRNKDTALHEPTAVAKETRLPCDIFHRWTWTYTDKAISIFTFQFLEQERFSTSPLSI